MRWTRKGIIAEIRRLHEAGAELNYATAETRYLNLVRASAWHFGTWKMAIEAAGLDYNALSKYRRWNRALIVDRIRALHKEGKDLSWRSISVDVDPPLAAAALRPNGFASWRDALAAAGLDPNEVSRYESWNTGRVVQEIKGLHRRNIPLSSKTAQQDLPKLFTAARRRFGSWDNALAAAGLDAGKIRLRRANLNEARPRVAVKPASRALAANPDQLQLALPSAPSKGRAGRKTAAPAASKVAPQAAAAVKAAVSTAKAPATRGPAAKSAPAKQATSKAPAAKAAAGKAAVATTAKPKASVAKAPVAVKAPAAKNAKTAAAKVVSSKATPVKTIAKPVTKAPVAKKAAPAKVAARLTAPAAPAKSVAKKSVAKTVPAKVAPATKAQGKPAAKPAVKAPAKSVTVAKAAPAKRGKR